MITTSSGTHVAGAQDRVDRRAIAYWQTDYPLATVSRRYLHSDANGRALEAWSWPSSGTATQVWAIDPDAFGWDRVTVGSSVYQPLRADDGMRYEETETTAITNSGGLGTGPRNLRPRLHLEDGRAYDPFVGSYLQSAAASAVESYDGNECGTLTPATSTGTIERFRICRWERLPTVVTNANGIETIVLTETQVCDEYEGSGGSSGGGGGGDGPRGGGDGGGGGGVRPPRRPWRPSIPPHDPRGPEKECVETICMPKWENDNRKCRKLRDPARRASCWRQANHDLADCIRQCRDDNPPVPPPPPEEVLAKRY